MLDAINRQSLKFQYLSTIEIYFLFTERPKPGTAYQWLISLSGTQTPSIFWNCHFQQLASWVTMKKESKDYHTWKVFMGQA